MGDDRGPVLPLTTPAADPCTDRRGDDAWIAERWADPRARLLVFSAEKVAATTHPDAVATRWFQPVQVDGARDGDWVFLGIGADGTPYFAADLGDRAADVGTDLLTVRELGLAAVATPEFPLVITAVALLNWHRRHPRCPVCGTPTQPAEAGWLRICPTDETQHFPRVDPAVIMLVVGADGRALLGRQRRWPDTWFSTLAGFVEPGETLENAVRREVREEVGIPIGAVRYLASQPWPFPSSLMLGFFATAEQAVDPSPDGAEIAEARWFTPAALADACAAGEVQLPPRLSISRWLIEQWYGQPLSGDWSRR